MRCLELRMWRPWSIFYSSLNFKRWRSVDWDDVSSLSKMNSMKNWIIAKILSIEIYPPFPFQVFLRAGVLSHLDEEREDKLRDQVVRLQAVCRGHLARRHVQKLKVTIKLQQKSCRGTLFPRLFVVGILGISLFSIFTKTNRVVTLPLKYYFCAVILCAKKHEFWWLSI